MIVYLDASALVKRYVAEAGSDDVNALVGEATALGTAVISRAEVAAALGKAARARQLPEACRPTRLSVDARGVRSVLRPAKTEPGATHVSVRRPQR